MNIKQTVKTLKTAISSNDITLTSGKTCEMYRIGANVAFVIITTDEGGQILSASCKNGSEYKVLYKRNARTLSHACKKRLAELAGKGSR